MSKYFSEDRAETMEPADSNVLNSCSDFFSVFMAFFLLLFFSPVMILIALLIYLFDGSPVFYRGVRIGKNGRLFTMYKFRTLVADAEQRIGGRLMMENEGLITPLGHYLRCLKLDELPQLINILKGDMNFVGPRPVRTLMAERYAAMIPRYSTRFTVKPGLTGLAQIRGGYYCPPKRKTRYDLFYIKKRSAMLDMKLFILTALRAIVSPVCLKSGNSRPIGYFQRSYEKRQNCRNSASSQEPA